MGVKLWSYMNYFRLFLDNLDEMGTLEKDAKNFRNLWFTNFHCVWVANAKKIINVQFKIQKSTFVWNLINSRKLTKISWCRPSAVLVELKIWERYLNSRSDISDKSLMFSYWCEARKFFGRSGCLPRRNFSKYQYYVAKNTSYITGVKHLLLDEHYLVWNG